MDCGGGPFTYTYVGHSYTHYTAAKEGY